MGLAALIQYYIICDEHAPLIEVKIRSTSATSIANAIRS